MDTDTFGALLKHYRLAAGLTQEALAEQAHLSVRALSDLERGTRRKPRQETLALLAEALHLSAAEGVRLEARIRRTRSSSRPVARPVSSTSAFRSWRTPLTRLIGREREESAAVHLVRQAEIRLLTLTGPAGVGKTRLALQVAESLQTEFSEGVHFVALETIREPLQVLTAIAQSFDLRDTGGQPLAEIVATFLRSKQLLLILDNFEHVLAAASLVAGLLEACPHLKVLVTSRAVLHVRGEQELVVPPLAVPDLAHLPALADLGLYGSVALFVQRARAVKPTFALTERQAPLVAEVCVRLDGLPLAIELVAARIRLLSPQALLARLEYRFPLLSGGAQDLPERQQAMGQAIGWSYDLLTAAEQRLFRLLSVFLGVWTLEEAEAIAQAAGYEGNVLDGLTSLIAKSLVQQRECAEEEPGFQMLETIRAYGLEHLEEAGEAERVRRCHAAYYLALAEAAEPALKTSEQRFWLERLDQAYPNLRAALRWFLQESASEQVLRFWGALTWFWVVRGLLQEGRQFLDQAWLLREDATLETQAKTLYQAGMLLVYQSDFRRVLDLNQEGASILEALGDPSVSALASLWLGYVSRVQGDHVAARASYEAALAMMKAAKEDWHVAEVLWLLADVEFVQGNLACARSQCEESLALLHNMGDRQGSTITLNLLADIVLQQGEIEHARGLTEEALAIWRVFHNQRSTPYLYSAIRLGHIQLYRGDAQSARMLLQEGVEVARTLGDRIALSTALGVLGLARLAQGEAQPAEMLLQEGVELALRLNSKRCIAAALESLGRIVSAQGQDAWATRLWSVAERICSTAALSLSLLDRSAYEQAVKETRLRLGESAFTHAWEEGQTLSPEQVVGSWIYMKKPGDRQAHTTAQTRGQD